MPPFPSVDATDYPNPVLVLRKRLLSVQHGCRIDQAAKRDDTGSIPLMQDSDPLPPPSAILIGFDVPTAHYINIRFEDDGETVILSAGGRSVRCTEVGPSDPLRTAMAMMTELASRQRAGGMR
jgi:hypothetical protein